MKGRKRIANEIMDIATTVMQRGINKNRDGPHQTYDIQRKCHDIESRTHQIPPSSII